MYDIFIIGIAVSLTSGALWMAAFIPIQLFPVLLVSPLRTHGTLSIIAALTMFSFVFTLIALPETKVLLLHLQLVNVHVATRRSAYACIPVVRQ